MLITFLTKNDELVNVDKEIAMKMDIVSHMIKDLGEHNDSDQCPVIPLTQITSKNLSMITDLLQRIPLFESAARDEIKDVTDSDLLEILLSANFLGIEQMYRYTCKVLAFRIDDMEVDKVKELFL